jgi:hypothetical protein
VEPVSPPPHPAKANAAQTSISANRLLIARSPENEIESKLFAPGDRRAFNMVQHPRSA